MRRIRIVHHTGYSYETPAIASFNEARMVPGTDADQRLLEHRMEIYPKAWTQEYVDYWGTRVVAFEVHQPHSRLDVTSVSVVEVSRSPLGGLGLSWDDLSAPAVEDRFAEFLDISDRVDPGPELRDRLQGPLLATQGPREFAPLVGAFIHDEVRYVTGSTTVHTRAMEAWKARAGVCQDLAHLMVGALRVAKVPARYVSGYVLPDGAADVGTEQTGESHAWVEYWDGRWIGWDPTSGRAVGDSHVRVGAAPDYGRVSPLRGIYNGGPGSNMFVEVGITLLSGSPAPSNAL